MKYFIFILVIIALPFLLDAYSKSHNCPLTICKHRCLDEQRQLNTIVRLGNTTNTYSCECDNK